MTSDRKLITIGADGKDLKELASSNYGAIGSPAWSPDGKLIAYSKTDVSRSTDIYLIPSAGGEEKKITFDSASEANPRFSADGTKVYFVRREGDIGGEATADRRSSSASRSRSSTRDPDEADQRPDGSPAEAGPETRRRGDGGPGGHAQDAEHRLGRPEAAHPPGHADGRRSSTYIPGNDGKTLIFVGSEGGAGGGGGRAVRRPGRRRHSVDLHDPG